MRWFVLLLVAGFGHAQTLDILLTGGRVIDGSGSPERLADVGITGDVITFIGSAQATQVKARRTINVAGLIVSPGFIDPHTHTLEDLSGPKRSNDEYLLQGVTTVVNGNDGSSSIDIGKVFEKWKRQGIGTNAALYIGQGSVRQEVMGMTDAAPTPEQLEAMRKLVRQAMTDGALGLSSGLFYAPGSYAKTEEVVELAKVAAALGGVYDTHMRDESSYSIGVLGAIRESITIAKESGIPLHISHIKVQGPAVWGKSDEAIRMIREAKAQGVQISADQYPYTGSGTSLEASLVPRWAQVGGNAHMLARLSDPKLIAGMERNLAVRGGADLLLITTARDKRLIGKTLEQIARERNETPVAAAIAVIRDGGAGVASLNIQESDLENFMKQDFVVTGSDGSAGHPRKYGTFPRKLRIYVRERGLISLPFFIQHSSALTAQQLHMERRGLIKEGYFADVIAFDYATITDKSTYEHPELYSEGMKYVLVNGQVAVENGAYTGALAGVPVKPGSTRSK
jgi:N-acyl-D-aspartate/D-glutamate deacylase